MQLTFVVGTGRCGSTLLSRLLREHPDVLSMSEFFSTLRIAAAAGRAGFPVGDMDGVQLWRLLATPFPMLDAMVSDGLRTSEMLYPADGRFGPATGIPLVSHYVLPMLGRTPTGCSTSSPPKCRAGRGGPPPCSTRTCSATSPGGWDGRSSWSGPPPRCT